MPRKSMRCISALIAALLAAVSALASDAVIFNPSSGLRLAAIVTMPPKGEPRAGVVLISGSGQQDRDETVFGHKPFRAIADSLAAAGYAVLRYDDRGVGGSDPDPNLPAATTDHLATDAVACLHHLDSLLGGRTPVGCIGHSEGGSIAIKIAANRLAPVDFIVTLAAPAFRGDSIILDQVRSSLEYAGQQAAWKTVYPTLRARYDMLMSPVPDFTAKASLYAELSSQPEAALADKARLKAEVDVAASPWFRQLLRYDPAADIKAVGMPWLAINGDRDTQVAPSNLQRIAELNDKADTKLMPGINHILLQAPTGQMSEYPRLQGDADPIVITEIINFLNNLTF